MNRNRIIIVLCFLTVIAVLIWWLTRSPEKPVQPLAAQREETKTSGTTPASPVLTAIPSPTSSADAEQKKKQALEQVTQAFTAPIVFYGKVIDQYGDPVPDADIGYTAADKFNASGSNYTGKSNAQGLFEISGIQGAGLGVAVRKGGYHFIDESDRSSASSAATFAYGMGPDSYRRPAPSKDNPAIFVLHKMGETVPLVQVSSRQIDVPRTGQPLNVDLMTGRTGQGDLQVTSWIGDSKRRPFDWRYQLSIPGGGLIERKGQFNFEAPAEGYQSTVETNMTTTAEQWTSRLTKEYFAKFGDGKYARFSIRFYAGERNFVVLESYLNPTPGDRNLEFDPNKVVKPK